MYKATILIVEDDGILAFHLQEMLSSLGYGIAGPLASGEEALDFVTANEVDLVLMDIELAGAMNGISAAETISNRTNIPIVFLTGFSQDPLLEEAKIAAPYGYLIKPVPERELAAAIEIALHRHRLDQKLRESQLALQKSEAKYRHLFENCPLGIFRTTMDGRFLAVNLEMTRILGCDTPEQVLREYTDLANQFYVNPNQRLEFISLLKENRAVDNFEFEAVNKRGEKLLISMNAKLTPADDLDKENETTVIDGFAIDMTVRKRAEEELYQTNAILQAAMDQSPAGIAIADAPDGRLRYVNEAGLNIRGGSQQTVVNNVGLDEYVASWQLLDLDGRPLLAEEVPLARAIQFGETCRREFIIRRSDTDDRIVQANAAPIRNKDGVVKAAIVVFTDITERKKSEEAQKTLQIQLQHAQKMEAIGTLAGGIAHDFNNILGAILGYAEMARDDCLGQPRVVSDLDQVIKAGHRAKELIKQILTFSRQEETQSIPLQPSTIIRETIKMLRSSLPTTIAIKQDINSNTSLILADPTQIHQILINLSTNAFHAMEERGGTLTISLKNRELSQQDLIGIGHCQTGKYVQISIADNGSGMSKEVQEKMFEPYFTTKVIGKGTGLGLAIVHGIVKSYGGFISFDSQIGKGTVFQIFIPALEKDAAYITDPIERPPVGVERVLFIDDESTLAEMAETMLTRLGYAVTIQTSSLEALQTFVNNPDDFDLVITDHTMPGMTGMDLARRMLQIRPQLPIILCTGYSSQISEEKALLAGIKGFALKPLTKSEIAKMIRKVLNQPGATAEKTVSS